MLPFGTVLQVDVHHVAVFVEDGQDELVLARATFVEVEAGRQGVFRDSLTLLMLIGECAVGRRGCPHIFHVLLEQPVVRCHNA